MAARNLCRSARTSGNCRVPPPHIGKAVGDGELGGLEKIDRDHAGNIGDRIGIAGGEGPTGELAIENPQEFFDPRLVDLDALAANEIRSGGASAA